MLQEIFDTIVLRLPVFLLLAMMFGAGFLILHRFLQTSHLMRTV